MIMSNELSRPELVRSRRSVRSFDGRRLNPADLDAVLHFAEAAESPYNLPIVWRILSTEEYGLSCPVISGTDTFIAGKMKKTPHAEEAFGYAFERVVLYAQSLGLGTTWIAGTMDRPAFERAMHLEGDEVMPCISPLGYPAVKMSLRESVMRKGVKADSRMAFEDLFFKGDFSHPLRQDEAEDFSEALEMVRWAPSAVNRQPWRLVITGDSVHFYEKHGKGFTAENGWDIQKIDMGIALCHFAFGMETTQRTLLFLIDDPGIAVPAGVSYLASYRFV